MTLVIINSLPIIDGILNDACWLNDGEWEMVDSVYHKDLSKPLPKKIAKAILDNKFNLKMEPRGFIVMVLKKK